MKGGKRITDGKNAAGGAGAKQAIIAEHWICFFTVDHARLLLQNIA